MGSPQPSQKAETLLGFLSYGACVVGPGEVLCHVNTKEFGPLDDLYKGSIDVKGTVVALWSPEVNFFVLSIFRDRLLTFHQSVTPLCMLTCHLLIIMSSGNLLMWFKLCIAARGCSQSLMLWCWRFCS